MSNDERVRILVNYRSGHSMTFECDEFTLSRNQISGSLSAQWSSANPDPIKLSLDDIESIWQL